MDAAARRTLQEDLLRLREGDRAAARPVFDALWPACLALARAAVGEADAPDVAQSALVKLFSQAAAFDPARSGLGWALALTTWEARTQRKKHRRRREDAAVPEVAVPAVDLVNLVKAEDVERVASAFVSLTEQDQQTLRAFLDGEASGDAAGRKRRQRAVDRLRALVFGDSHG